MNFFIYIFIYIAATYSFNNNMYELLLLFLFESQSTPGIISLYLVLSPAADGVPVQKDGEQVRKLPITPTY